MKHSEVKQHIIRTASFLFYKNGYNRTGINQIISEAGIAKATLYHHFKSKEDICLAYLRFKNTTFLKDIEEYCNTKAGGKARIIGLFEFLQLFFLDSDFNGCWCIKTVAEIPKENQKIRSEIQLQKTAFIQLIEKLIVENLLKSYDEISKALSRQVYLLYECAVAESHLHQEDWPIKEAKMLCARII
ncbi:MAG: TetR/AcrR family transcriptional regulator [Bacteroidota bacterium]